MIDSELPWAINRTAVLMKEEMDVVGTTPVDDTNDSGESDLEWPEERTDVSEEPGILSGNKIIKKSPEQR